jgi:hypothetical protein
LTPAICIPVKLQVRIVASGSSWPIAACLLPAMQDGKANADKGRCFERAPELRRGPHKLLCCQTKSGHSTGVVSRVLVTRSGPQPDQDRAPQRGRSPILAVRCAPTGVDARNCSFSSRAYSGRICKIPRHPDAGRDDKVSGAQHRQRRERRAAVALSCCVAAARSLMCAFSRLPNQSTLAVVGSIILRISVILVAGNPLNSACLRITCSSAAR